MNIRAEGAGSVAAQSIVGSAIATGENSVAMVGDFVPLQSVVLPPDSVYTRVALDRFVGREWLEQRVNEFLAAKDRGVFVLEAGAGLGKTAFLAHLAKSRGWCAHFVETAPGASGVEAGLFSLAAQLVQRWKLEPYCGAKSLPGRAGRAGFLTTLLSEAAAKRDATQPGQPVVLVVDALDESFAAEGQNVLGLPRTLPKGVYLIVSQRPVPVTLDIVGVTPEVVKLEAGATNNRADMRRFLENAAARPAIADVLQRCKYTAEQFAETLAERCGGVWIYLQYVITEIENGNRDPLVLDELPAGVWQYYAEYWKRWRRKPEWAATQLPLIVALAAAQEDVSLAQLTEFSGGVNATTARELLEGPWRPFITIVPPAGPEGVARYRCYHASLREFLDGRVDTAGFTTEHETVARELAGATRAAHTRIARRFLEAWGGLAAALPALQGKSNSLSPEDYGLRHVVAHLAAGDDPGLLADLLTTEWSEPIERTVQRVSWRGWLDRLRGRQHVVHDTRYHNTWFTVKSSRGELAGYLRDLDRAAHAAAEQSRAFLTAGQPAPTVALEARYALMRASVRALAGNLGPGLLATLVAQKLLSPAEGRAYAEQTPDESQRIEALLHVAPLLVEPARTEAYRSALATFDLLDPHALLQLPKRLKLAAPDRVWLELVGAWQQRFRHEPFMFVTCLVELVPHLPDSVIPEVCRRALQPEKNDVRLLTALLPRLAPADRGPLMQELEAYLTRKQGHLLAFELGALLCVSSLLGEPRRDALIAEARAAIRKERDLASFARALLRVAGHRLHSQIADEIVAAALRLTPHELVQQLGSLLGALPIDVATGRPVLETLGFDVHLLSQLQLHQVRALARSKEFAEAKVKAAQLAPGQLYDSVGDHGLALAALAEHAPDTELAALLDDALAAPVTEGRIQTMDVLAPKLTRAQLVRVLAGSRSIGDRHAAERTLLAFIHAHAAGGPDESLFDAVARVEWFPGQALAAAAPGIPLPSLPRAAKLARTVHEVNERALAMGALAAQDPAHRESWMKEAFQLAGTIDETRRNAELLAEFIANPRILQALSAGQRAQVFEELFALLRLFAPLPGSLYDAERALEKVGPHLDADSGPEALEALSMLPRPWTQQTQLLHLAVHAGHPALARWMTCENLLGREPFEEVTLRSQTWPAHIHAEVENILRARSARERVERLLWLIPRANKVDAWNQNAILRAAILAAVSIRDRVKRPDALGKVRPFVNFFGQRAIDAAINPAPATTPATPGEAWRSFAALLLQAGATGTIPPGETVPSPDPDAQEMLARLKSLPHELREAAWLELAATLAPEDAERVIGECVGYYLSDARHLVCVLRVYRSPVLLDAIRVNLLHPPAHGHDYLSTWQEAIEWLTEPAIAAVLRRWDDSISREQRARWLTALQHRLESEPVLAAYDRWRELLARAAESSREKLFTDLGTLAPLAARLAGNAAVPQLFHAVRKTVTWWP